MTKPVESDSSDCIFCKIIEGVIPAKKILENESVLAFLDIFPAAQGHTLVIPKEHHRDIHSIPAGLYGLLAETAKEVADLLMKQLGSEGTTIFQMNREAGWQSVFHAHFHVIPRWDGDSLHKPWVIAPALDKELSNTQRKILG